MNPTPIELASIIMIITLVITFIIGAFFIIARVGGWGKLSQYFMGPATAPRVDTEDRFNWVSARMKYGMRYNNALTIMVSKEGIHIRITFFMRLGHPPLFIPWGAVKSLTQSRLFLAHHTELAITLPDQSTVSITFQSLREGIGFKIEEQRRAYQEARIHTENILSEKEVRLKEESSLYRLDQD